MPKKSGRTARTQPHRRLPEKERLRAEKRTALEMSEAELDQAEGQAATIVEEHAGCTRGVGRLKNATGRALRMAPCEQQIPRNHEPAATPRAGNLPDWANSAPALLAETSSLDQRLMSRAEQITRSKRGQREARKEGGMR